MEILHLTAHVGGGVGKALSGLVAQASASGSGVQHRIVCLEEPEKEQFVGLIRGCKGEIIVCPSINRLERLIRDTDILQLEWWNHPATIECLCSLPLIPIRLLSWSHTSGLHNPIIPEKLILASHKFLFTSRCSFEANEVRNLATEQRSRLGVVSSCGGFSGLPEVWGKINGRVSVGYLGSLNFAKLHPNYIDYIAAVDISGFRVRMIGDLTNHNILNQQCDSLGKTGMLEFRGYSTDIASDLADIDVLAYLLNPEHYGTTENALLEAMAMGIVPVVLDNPCERQIVDDYNTGLIVNSPGEFAEAILWLHQNPDKRRRLGKQAAKSVRERFSVEKMEASLNLHYQEVLSMEKKEVVFSDIFGTDPAEWFLSCQGDKNIFADNGYIHLNGGDFFGYGLFEKTKGTVSHFNKYFPDNLKLKLWAENLKSLQ
jgi:glycosyltransferase involved in cell wall biosynthesis